MARTDGPLTAMATDCRRPAAGTLRKRVHLACFLIFLALPFLNVVRFDIPRQRFYFAGQELWISEFGIVFFSLMFLMFLVVVSSVFYGRVYCGYLCPQMIFSEASMALESRLRRWVTKRFIAWKPAARAWMRPHPVLRRRRHRLGFSGLRLHLLFRGASGFAPPPPLLRCPHRRRHLRRRRHAGDLSSISPSSASASAPPSAPTAICRECSATATRCWSITATSTQSCIECKKCVRVCPMGIDIRKSPFQIECIHCAECIDACDEILARLHKPGLIHYTWGEKGPLASQQRQPWDAKRIVVLLVLAFYACGLTVALAMRRAVLVRIQPERATLYRLGADGRVYNTFRYTSPTAAASRRRSHSPSAICPARLCR